MIEQSFDTVQLKVHDDQGKSIGYFFGWLEAMKGNFAIAEYSASTTTLEQVFDYFAKGAERSSTKINRALTRRASTLRRSTI